MATLKSMHKYHLKLLALQSTIDHPLKDLFAYLITQVSPSNSNREELPYNVNSALSELLESSIGCLRDMHFVTSYPRMQKVIFDDVSFMELNDEIRISKLDTLTICDILMHLPELRAEVETENLSKCIEYIQNLRILVATVNNDVFWEQFDSATEGVKLSLNAEPQTWGIFWKDAKLNITKILKFVKENEVLKEIDYNQRLEEFHLFTTWSKQELLQNWYRQLNHQWKSLTFLHQTERKFTTKTEANIKIRLSDRPLVASPAVEVGWFDSFIGAIKWFVSPYAPEHQPSTTIRDYELDSEVAQTLTETLKIVAVNTFGSEAFVEVGLQEASKGVRLFDEESDTIIPLVLEIQDVRQNGDGSLTAIGVDPYSNTSNDAWSEISAGIKECIKQKMKLSVDCIRTGWHAPRKINMCLTKAADNKNHSWTTKESFSLIDHLKKWKFPTKLRVKLNPELLENVATLMFNVSTTNAKFFEILQQFATLVNEKTSTVSVNVKEINEAGFVEKLGLAHSLATLQKAASQMATKRDDSDEGDMDVIVERHPISLEGSLSSRSDGGGNSSRISSPRIIITPAYTSQKSPREHGNKSNENSPRVNQDLQNSPRVNQNVQKSTNQQSFIPRRQEKRNSEEKIENTSDMTDCAPKRSLKLNQDWLKLEIIKEFMLKPALLDVLHNEVTTKEPRTTTTATSFPRDPKKLYHSLQNLRQKHPKSFDIWRKTELNNTLLPTDGKKESNSNLWSIDMVYFVIRSSHMFPAPKEGWHNYSKKSSFDDVTDATGFWCWEAKRLKMDIDQGKVTCADKCLLERVEGVLKELGFRSELLVQMKECKPIEQLLCSN